QRGNSASNVAASVRIVGQRHGHEQRAEVGVAQAQRPEVVGVFGNLRRGIAGEIDEDFLRGDGYVDRVLIGFNVKLAVGIDILYQIQRSEIASRVIQEHVFRARV